MVLRRVFDRRGGVMRVVHVIDTLARGGAEHLLVTLLPALKAQGIDASVAVLRPPYDLQPELEAAGIPVTRLPRRHRWALPLVARDIARASRPADIVHAHLYFPAVTTALMRILRLSRARTCVTFHNLAYAGANTADAKLAFRRRLAGAVYPRGMDRCFGVSQAVADHYGAVFGLPVTVLHNPVDLSRIGEGAGPRTTSGSECRIILPGRVVKEKGHADLVDALAILRDRGLTPHLDIAGDGPLAKTIAARVEDRGLSSQVTFHGALPHVTLMQLVGAADIAAVPSRFEGFGLTALEAMALGRAVVASDVGGLPEVVDKAGVSVAAGDANGLADALQALCNDPARRIALGNAARARAALFDVVGVAATLRDSYSAVNAGGGQT